ncbi:MAG: hypothetical protein VST72_01485 [Nitrospirota bacterium]|nr:hypothetical protein [Nitrospirota bacterium]
MKKAVLPLIVAMLLTSCVVVSDGRRHGPPPWAPVHTYPAPYVYYYYPSAYVYYDINRRVYFYMAGGGWIMSPVLPPSIIINVNEAVTLELESPKPYTQFKKHKKRFPAGEKHYKSRQQRKKH